MANFFIYYSWINEYTKNRYEENEIISEYPIEWLRNMKQEYPDNYYTLFWFTEVYGYKEGREFFREDNN